MEEVNILMVRGETGVTSGTLGQRVAETRGRKWAQVITNVSALATAFEITTKAALESNQEKSQKKARCCFRSS